MVVVAVLVLPLVSGRYFRPRNVPGFSPLRRYFRPRNVPGFPARSGHYPRPTYLSYFRPGNVPVSITPKPQTPEVVRKLRLIIG